MATAGICEDDDELRSILRDALTREGFTVRATASGGLTFTKRDQTPPEAALSEEGERRRRQGGLARHRLELSPDEA